MLFYIYIYILSYLLLEIFTYVYYRGLFAANSTVGT